MLRLNRFSKFRQFLKKLRISPNIINICCIKFIKTGIKFENLDIFEKAQEGYDYNYDNNI